MKSWREALLQIALYVIWGMVGAVIVISGYHATVHSARATPLAAIDLVGLIQEQRERGVREALRRGASVDEDYSVRQLALFSARVESAARDVAAARHLILVQSQSVVAGQVPDVTDEVRRLLDGGEMP